MELKADNIRRTMIVPGAVATEIPESSSDENLSELYKIAMPASSITNAIEYAIEQPAEVEIDEIVNRPTAQVF